MWLLVLRVLQANMVGLNFGDPGCATAERFGSRHGPVSKCPISATKAILQEYMALSEGSTERKKMEARYGRSTLQRLVTEYEEERAFHEWLESCTGSPCPGCDLRVEKHSGCNHVRSLGLRFNRRLTRSVDDMCQMRTTLLLSVRGKARSQPTLQTFFDAGVAMFLEAVRRREHR